jgi:hypothetical protein
LLTLRCLRGRFFLDGGITSSGEQSQRERRNGPDVQR